MSIAQGEPYSPPIPNLFASPNFPLSTIDSDSVTVYNTSMREHKQHLTIEQLAQQVGISVRTIRYYITEGLLPGPEGRGKATIYGEEHLLKLRLIRLLSQQYMPLAEMYHLLNRLSIGEIQALLTEEEQSVRDLEHTSQQPTPQEYIANLLKSARTVREAPPVEYSFPTENRRYEKTHVDPVGETWKHWELVPGIELHIHTNVEEQHRSLIARIFKAAGIPYPDR